MPDRPIRFLIVDDIPENILALDALLRRDGLVIDHAQTAADFVARGRDVEGSTLAQAVRWHAQHRVLADGRRTVVFS